jgi:hypothetical protein
MNERNLNEGQWEDRKQWSLGFGQRRKKPFETDRGLDLNKDFGEKTEGKNQLGNPRSKWKDVITIDLKINGAKT